MASEPPGTGTSDPHRSPPRPGQPAEFEQSPASEPPGVPLLLGMALKGLRKRYAGTQQAFAERTHKSQSYVSAAERGISGWDSVNEWASAVGTVGADPVDLLRLAVAHAEEDPELREVLTLWARAPKQTRGAILILLRATADGHSEGQ